MTSQKPDPIPPEYNLSQAQHYLSQAQIYYLQALGVDLYGLNHANSDADERSFASQAPAISTPTPTTPKPAAASSLAEIKRKLGGQSQGVQSQDTQESGKRAKVELVSEAAFKQSKLVADLCVLYGVDEIKQISTDYFQLGSIHWRFVEKPDRAGQQKLVFADNKLISEPLDKLNDTKTKRDLWSYLLKVMS